MGSQTGAALDSEKRARCGRGLPKPVLATCYCFVVIFVSMRQPVLWFLETNKILEDARWERSAYLNLVSLIIYCPAMVLGLKALRPAKPLGVALAAFFSWTIGTSFVNRTPEAQVHDLIMVMSTLLAFLGLNELVGVDRLLAGVFAATQFGIALSVSVLIISTGGIHYAHGPWAGVFGNKNHFGSICGINALTACHIILQRRSAWRFWKVGLMLMPLASSLWVLVFMTLNVSGRVGIVLGGAGCGFTILSKQLLQLGGPLRLKFLAVRTVLLAFTVAVLTGVIVARETLSTLFGKSSSFTGRTRFWSEGLTGTLERPFTGWGWWAAHDNPSFKSLFESFSGMTTHSFWVQTALGSGLVGFMLALVLFVIGLASLSEAYFSGKLGIVPAVWVPIYLIVFFSAEDVRSQYAMGFSLLITLMFAAVRNDMLTTGAHGTGRWRVSSRSR